MKINIGKCFSRLINKHFPSGHKFHKIFKRYTLKLSYSCMPNLQLINSHNQNLFKEQLQSTLETCNCLKKEDYRMNGLCLTDCLLYYATIICDKENYTKLYKGTRETTKNHKKSNVPNYKNDTKLSNEYCPFKTKELNSKVPWKIKTKCWSYNLIFRRL